jgi:uncharacterized protein (TIGR02588 family)
MAARGRKRERQRRSGNETAAPRSRVGASESEAQSIPILEWVVGGIGFLMIAGVLGFLLHTALKDRNPRPDIRLSVNEVLQSSSGYLVRITASNEGGSTAAGVIVEGELRRGADLIERSETLIEFLPSHSKKRAGLFFSKDPSQFELKLRPHGYEEP